MSGVVANIRRCKNCKNIYDANIGLNMIRCPYCFKEQTPIFIPEYYVAAEPPVRRGESHLSGQTEPPCY